MHLNPFPIIIHPSAAVRRLAGPEINKIAGDLLKTMTGAFMITLSLFCGCYVAVIEYVTGLVKRLLERLSRTQ